MDIVERLRSFVDCEGGDIADVAEAADAIDSLRGELEMRRKSSSATDRLHNICQAISEEADGSEWSREEWERIDAENVSLRAQVAALEQDAKRYRWLRDKFTRIGVSAWPDCDDATDGPAVVRELRVMEHFRPTDAASTDAAIDAAMG